MKITNAILTFPGLETGNNIRKSHRTLYSLHHGIFLLYVELGTGWKNRLQTYTVTEKPKTEFVGFSVFGYYSGYT